MILVEEASKPTLKSQGLYLGILSELDGAKSHRWKGRRRRLLAKKASFWRPSGMLGLRADRKP